MNKSPELNFQLFPHHHLHPFGSAVRTPPPVPTPHPNLRTHLRHRNGVNCFSHYNDWNKTYGGLPHLGRGARGRPGDAVGGGALGGVRDSGLAAGGTKLAESRVGEDRPYRTPSPSKSTGTSGERSVLVRRRSEEGKKKRENKEETDEQGGGEVIKFEG